MAALLPGAAAPFVGLTPAAKLLSKNAAFCCRLLMAPMEEEAEAEAEEEGRCWYWPYSWLGYSTMFWTGMGCSSVCNQKNTLIKKSIYSYR